MLSQVLRMLEKTHWRKKLLEKLNHYLLPSHCLFCHQSTGCTLLLCDACQKDLPILPESCPRCAKTLFTPKETPNLLCGACLQNPPPFAQTFALFPYKPPVTRLIVELKFAGRLTHATLLGQLMAQQVQEKWYGTHPLPTLLLPVPLHKKRLCERGFNQALEIARPIAKQYKIPLDTTGLKRSKATLPQSFLTKAERHKNLQQAFTAQRDYSGHHIALIDDVMTTGETVREISTVLKKAGAQQIDIWCAARRDIL